MVKPDRMNTKAMAAPIRGKAPTAAAKARPARSKLKVPTAAVCDDCKATTAFQAWRSFTLTPSFNVGVDFASWHIVPAGKRATIELITAEIRVPSGEQARLRLFTSLGSASSNLDLFLTFQGNVGPSSVYTATHSLRAYSDGSIQFNVNRDNATTQGEGLICISGYIAG